MFDITKNWSKFLSTFFIVAFLVPSFGWTEIKAQFYPSVQLSSDKQANRPLSHPGRLIVALKKNSPVQLPSSVLSQEDLVGGVKLSRVEVGSEDKVKKALKASGKFDVVSEDTYLTPGLAPNDRFYNTPPQSLLETFMRQFPYANFLGLEQAWDITIGEQDTIIAFIDAGFFYLPNTPFHEDHIQQPSGQLPGDLQGQYKLPGRRFFVNGEDTDTSAVPNLPFDRGWHGFWTSGVANGIMNNFIGIAGIAPRCPILPIRAMENDGGIPLSNVLRAMIYAADNGARVINMSLAPSSDIPIDEQQANWNLINIVASYAKSKNCVVVESAGNSGTARPITGLTNIEIISATNNAGRFITKEEDQFLGFSSFGAGFVDNAAPGMFITTLYHQNIFDEQGRSLGMYNAINGTSFSAPIVASLYALIFSINPLLTPDEAISLVHVNSLLKQDPQYVGNGVVQFEPTVRAAIFFRGVRPLIRGDINFDLQLTSGDLDLLIQIVNGTKRAPTIRESVRFQAADVNSDSIINVQDISLLIQKLQGS